MGNVCSDQGPRMRGHVSESTGAGHAGSQLPGQCLGATNRLGACEKYKTSGLTSEPGLSNLHVSDTHSSLSTFASRVLEVKQQLS